MARSCGLQSTLLRCCRLRSLVLRHCWTASPHLFVRLRAACPLLGELTIDECDMSRRALGSRTLLLLLLLLLFHEREGESHVSVVRCRFATGCKQHVGRVLSSPLLRAVGAASPSARSSPSLLSGLQGAVREVGTDPRARWAGALGASTHGPVLQLQLGSSHPGLAGPRSSGDCLLRRLAGCCKAATNDGRHSTSDCGAVQASGRTLQFPVSWQTA